VRTQRALAVELDVHPNTVTAWIRDGMPGGNKGPWDIVAVYSWAKTRGLTPSLPRDPELAKLCGAAIRPKGSDTPPRDAGVSQELIEIGRALGIETPREIDLDEDKRLLGWQRWASSINELLEIRVKRRDLIPRSAIKPYLQQLAAMVHASDVDLPARVVTDLAPMKLPAATLDAIGDAIRAARQQQREAIVHEAGVYAHRCVRGESMRPVDSGVGE
jgi:hypothetical protein